MAREAAPNVKPAQTGFSFKPLAGLAVAASVTAVVFFGVQGLYNSAPSDAGAVADNAQLPSAEHNLRSLPVAQEGEQGRVAAANFEAARRLHMQTLMRLHAQQASVNGGQGVLPLARVANHDAE